MAYIPNGTDYTVLGKHTGFDYDTLLTPDTTVGWRIYKITPENIELISATPVDTEVGLGDADGYNNMVYVLNEACKTMYSNSTYNATARSLKIEDIESVSTYDPPNDVSLNYGDVEFFYGSYTSYPNIFANELGQSVDGKGMGTLGLSAQDKIYSGYATGTTILARTNFYYTWTQNTSDCYDELLSGPDLEWSHWLASRNVQFESGGDNKIDFCAFLLSWGNICRFSLLDSYPGGSWTWEDIRPYVSMPLSKVFIGASGTGSLSSPYSLTVK